MKLVKYAFHVMGMCVLVSGVAIAAPWNQPGSAYCFERWGQMAVAKLNQMNGYAYRLDRFGVFVPSRDRMNRVPSHFFIYDNKYHYMWRKYAGYKHHPRVWSKAGVPAMRDYVPKCLDRYARDSRRPWVFPYHEAWRQNYDTSILSVIPDQRPPIER